MSLESIMEKKAQRVAAAKERKAEKEEQGFVPTILIERSPTGLYSCRYPRGNTPRELQGNFTNKARILAIAKARGIQVGE